MLDQRIVLLMTHVGFVFHSINIDNGALPVNNEEYKEVSHLDEYFARE
jgi:hypothetical protein